MVWNISRFEELDLHTLYRILQLRETVFVREQRCDCSDIDGEDSVALHLYGGAPVQAYARIFAPAASGFARIGRVVVAREARGQGQGYALMQAALAACASRWPDAPIEVHAQAYLRDFYESLGFEVVGELYSECGIPHLPMELHRH